MIQIVTDSSCDLPQELLERYGVTVVPLVVDIDGDTFRERVEITPAEFYARMARSVGLPRTSQPSPAVFAETFASLSAQGPVLCMTISSKLSGTYESACLGRDLAGVDVTVFDTLGGSLGHGLQVLKACELAGRDMALPEVLPHLIDYRDQMTILILLNTLENIVKGGRLSKFQGGLSALLDIKLLLHGVEGAVEVLEKVRGKRRFINRVLDRIAESCPDMSDRYVGITHFDAPEDAQSIAQALRERCSPRGIIVNDMGPTMATYAGAGGMIVSF